MLPCFPALTHGDSQLQWGGQQGLLPQSQSLGLLATPTSAALEQVRPSVALSGGSDSKMFKRRQQQQQRKVGPIFAQGTRGTGSSW
jgi:hypothetical protein